MLCITDKVKRREKGEIEGQEKENKGNTLTEMIRIGERNTWTLTHLHSILFISALSVLFIIRRTCTAELSKTRSFF